ncbi:hypothetical protein B0F90DRAFT_838706 [Multifurca ochricompacta]|uniref:Uncharacterized protein n=1 Tax=Multifurca ochricompacta TaxID=376703 RepID=A0AAD4M1L9_9AGAM|nr:hypothetical protein B0F90DRAFT_838706 [Multifurca ochricompacta]
MVVVIQSQWVKKFETLQNGMAFMLILLATWPDRDSDLAGHDTQPRAELSLPQAPGLLDYLLRSKLITYLSPVQFVFIVGNCGMAKTDLPDSAGAQQESLQSYEIHGWPVHQNIVLHHL